MNTSKTRSLVKAETYPGFARAGRSSYHGSRLGHAPEERFSRVPKKSSGTKVKECDPWNDEQSAPEELRDLLDQENIRLYEMMSMDPELCAGVE